VIQAASRSDLSRTIMVASLAPTEFHDDRMIGAVFGPVAKPVNTR